MPSILIELGNLNNAANAQTLIDGGFQTRLANTIADAVQRFSQTAQAAAYLGFTDPAIPKHNELGLTHFFWRAFEIAEVTTESLYTAVIRIT